MLFKPELIDKIVKGKKVQTRRVCKDSEYAVTSDGVDAYSPDGFGDNWDDAGSEFRSIHTETRALKWKVGRDYSVQPGRGKKGLLWCPNCKVWDELDGFLFEGQSHKEGCKEKEIPLRIKITRIKKQNLLDITEEDAKKEGAPFKQFPGDPRSSFLWYVHSVNNIKIKNGEFTNPDVWVLPFEVVSLLSDSDKDVKE